MTTVCFCRKRFLAASTLQLRRLARKNLHEEHVDQPLCSSLVNSEAPPFHVKEIRKKEILCTGLSASAMGPRAVDGGECTKGNPHENHWQRHALLHHMGYTPNHLLTVIDKLTADTTTRLVKPSA